MDQGADFALGLARSFRFQQFEIEIESPVSESTAAMKIDQLLLVAEFLDVDGDDLVGPGAKKLFVKPKGFIGGILERIGAGVKGAGIIETQIDLESKTSLKRRMASGNAVFLAGMRALLIGTVGEN